MSTECVDPHRAVRTRVDGTGSPLASVTRAQMSHSAPVPLYTSETSSSSDGSLECLSVALVHPSASCRLHVPISFCLYARLPAHKDGSCKIITSPQIHIRHSPLPSPPTPRLKVTLLLGFDLVSPPRSPRSMCMPPPSQGSVFRALWPPSLLKCSLTVACVCPLDGTCLQGSSCV